MGIVLIFGTNKLALRSWSQRSKILFARVATIDLSLLARGVNALDPQENS